MNIANAFLFFFFGACIGSYLNVLIYRLPQKLDTVKKSSFCRACLSPLRWYHNIPILSYVALRGRCGFCQSKISLQYPAIEFAMGLFALLLMPHEVTSLNLLVFCCMFAIGAIFLVHTIIDLRHKILPDQLNIALALILLPFSMMINSVTHVALGAIIGFGFTYLVTWIFYKIRGQIGLGGGDIKLFGALGLFLGPLGILHNIFLSCMVGAIVSVGFIASGVLKRDQAIPFGPFIILVASIQIYFPSYFTQFLRVAGLSFE